MLEYIAVGVLLVAAIYGGALALAKLWLRAMRPADRGVRVIPVRGHREDLEHLLRAIEPPVLLWDVGLDEDSRALARRLCADVPDAVVVEENTEDLLAVLETLNSARK
ncbi:MAG: hypothetical protein FWF49_05190 [Oscillospiraceae bacterium]|nr:hypothetical protein [Oscillospiraceae bacterium]